MKNLSLCPVYHCLLICVGKISIEISNDENKVNSALSRFLRHLSLCIFEASLMCKLCPLPHRID
jgi:hypothetical protein